MCSQISRAAKTVTFMYFPIILIYITAGVLVSICAYDVHADPRLLAKWSIGLDTHVPGSFGQLTEIEEM